ncbi:MAG: hypothetical protein JW934_00740 [Anaerolineae bacterium]|nr:hypothetical protein [Anaerolineae bacterium]
MAKTAIEGKAGGTPRDRYAELMVIIVVLVALVLAWGVKAGAETRAVHIEVEGLSASYGYNWSRGQVSAPDILKISNPSAGARFQTTITVSASVVSDASETTDALDAVAKTLNQRRLQDKELYQFLGGETVDWRGRAARRNQFAYVYVSADLLNPQVPVVLHGVDHIFAQGDTLYVVTLLTDESVYDDALVELERFLNSITFK